MLNSKKINELYNKLQSTKQPKLTTGTSAPLPKQGENGSMHLANMPGGARLYIKFNNKWLSIGLEQTLSKSTNVESSLRQVKLKQLGIGKNDVLNWTTDQGSTNINKANFDEIELADSKKLYLGSDNDLQIYHDGSDGYIADPTGTHLKVLTNQFQVKNAAGGENMAKFTQNDSVKLYYDNSLKFETTNTGADITGTLEFDSLSDGTITITDFVDEDNMASNSATKIPTQQSVKAYVDSEITGLVDSAPGALDTLNELAAALGDDANFATTVTNSIATKVGLTGDETIAGTKTFTSTVNLLAASPTLIFKDSTDDDDHIIEFRDESDNLVHTIRTNDNTGGGLGDSLCIGSVENKPLQFITQNVTRMVIDGSGNVDITGTITNATWNGDVIASAYLDSDTAHLTGSQTFSGTKTFSAGTIFGGDITLNADNKIKSDTTGTHNFIEFDDDSGSPENQTIVSSVTNVALIVDGNGNNTGQFEVLKAGTDSTATELFRIENDGDAVFTGDLYIPGEKKIQFDSADTTIYTNSDNPEDLYIESDEDMYLRPDDNLVIACGTTNYVTFDGTNQRVGIGTTTPDANLQIHSTSGTKLWLTAGGSNPADAASLRFAEDENGSNYIQLSYDGNMNTLSVDSNNQDDMTVWDRSSNRVTHAASTRFYRAWPQVRFSDDSGTDYVDAGLTTNTFLLKTSDNDINFQWHNSSAESILYLDSGARTVTIGEGAQSTYALKVGNNGRMNMPLRGPEFEHDHGYFAPTGSMFLPLFINATQTDLIRFQTPITWEYYDYSGSAWVDDISNVNNLKNMLDGRRATSYSVSNTKRKFRFVIERASTWADDQLFYIENTWSSIGTWSTSASGGGSLTPTMQVERLDGSFDASDDSNNDWTTNPGFTTDWHTTGIWDNFGLAMFYVTDQHNAETHIRVTVTFPEYADTSKTINIKNIGVMSSYSSQNTNQQPFIQNFDRHATSAANVNVTGTLAIGDVINASAELHIKKNSTNARVRVQTTNTNGVAYTRLENDAQIWDLRVDGGSSDNFIIRNETTSTNRFLMDTSGNVDLTGDLMLRGEGGIFIENSAAGNGGSIIQPAGGMYRTSSNTHTGAIKITVPRGTGSNPADMISFWVDVFDYGTNQAFTAYIAGYVYQDVGANEWHNVSAQIFGNLSQNNYAVRFGHDSSNHCVLIGEVDTVWNYMQVTVRNVQVGYSADIDDYKGDWTITFETSLPTIDETLTGNFPIASRTIGTADVATQVTLTDQGGDSTCFPVFSTANTGDRDLHTDSSALTYDSTNGNLTSTTLTATNLTATSKLSVTTNSDAVATFKMTDDNWGYMEWRKNNNDRVAYLGMDSDMDRMLIAANENGANEIEINTTTVDINADVDISGNLSATEITSGAVVWERFAFANAAAASGTYHFKDVDDTTNNAGLWDATDTDPTSFSYLNLPGQYIVPENCTLKAMHVICTNFSSNDDIKIAIYHGTPNFDTTSDTTLALAGTATTVSIGTMRRSYGGNATYDVDLDAGDIVVPTFYQNSGSSKAVRGNITLKFVTR